MARRTREAASVYWIDLQAAAGPEECMEALAFAVGARPGDAPLKSGPGGEALSALGEALVVLDGLAPEHGEAWILPWLEAARRSALPRHGSRGAEERAGKGHRAWPPRAAARER